MKKTFQYLAALSLIFAITSSCDKNDNDDVEEPEDQIEIPEGYSLVWSDEFDDATIDMGNWQHETGDGTDYGLPAGWGNNELQVYTESAENSGIAADGDLSALKITALNNGPDDFTSAKLTTKDKISVRFGRIDVRAKMPQGQGIWPAIWMLGDNIDEIDWPGCGEIDIVEVLGHEPQKMYATVHYTNNDNSHRETQESFELLNGNFSDDYHTFSIDWTPESITFSVDGTTVQEVPVEVDMKEFLRSFYLVMNVAVGGYWPGYPDNTTTFPQSMYVDYIRVFEKDGFEAPAAPALDIEEESIGQNIEPGLAQHAINDVFGYLGNASIVVYGGGGEPFATASELAINGDSSLVFQFPGESWGGGYIELETSVDLSDFSYLKFSLNMPDNIADAEIKLESPSTNAAIFLIDYEAVEVGLDYQEYTILLADFEGLDLTEISIPFAVWNPQDADQNFTGGTVLIDNIYFTE